ncbi:hypothetical protein FQR65_LT12923 [Abscondita terminalis]|nr:hypothetical protein FQR65_LT12923 [Abscondita terminalis]
MQSLTIICLQCILFQVFGVEIPDTALTPEDVECMLETNVDRKTLETFFDEDYQVVTGNPLMESYSECWNKKMNFVNVNGAFDFVKLQRYVIRDLFSNFSKKDVINKEEIAKSAVEQCKYIRGSNIGDLGSKIYNCIAKQIRLL